jgi:hypothetical protein
MNLDKEKRTISLSKSITWFFIAASILILIYTYYRAEIEHHGLRFEQYFRFYVISLLGVLFFSLLLWLKDAVRITILTITISLLIGLYMAEAALHFFSPSIDSLIARKPMRVNVATKLGKEFDTREKMEVIKSFKAEGKDAVPLIYASYLIEQDGTSLYTLGGISNKTTLDDNEGGTYSIYLSDRYGFNNPNREWDSADINWLLIGDSFTRGTAVQVGEDIAGQIRNLTNSTVINLGMVNNGPLTELATLTEYAKSLRPQKVLWVYYENDLDNINTEKSVPLLMRYLEDDFSQHLMDRQEEINRELKELLNRHRLLSKTRLLRLGGLRAKIRKLIGSGTPDYMQNASAKIDPLFSKILTKAKERTESWGGELYFIYLPSFSHFIEPIGDDLYRKKKEVVELVKELSIPVLDIHQVFLGHPDPLSLFPLRMSGHYNAKGYSEVAKAIISSIGDQTK